VRTIALQNRKYLGSKRILADRIQKAIEETSGKPGVFFDVFLGTGAVSSAMIGAGIEKLIAVDNLLTNTVIFGGFFPLPASEEGEARSLMEKLNALEGKPGYLTGHFSDRYFSRLNCMRMDRIRDEIQVLWAAGRISAGVHERLLSSFLLSADRVANTLGQYDAFLKNIGAGEFLDGKHVSDRRVHEPFMLSQLEILPDTPRDIRTTDVFDVLDKVEADVAYCDPPYNTRQYSTNYHVLENIARWEKRPVFGKTRKIELNSLKSLFSMRRHAARALADLASRLKARHCFFSYSSEGILSKGEFKEILEANGPVSMREFPYRVFGNGAGVSRQREVT